MTPEQFHALRRFADTPSGRIAYIEQGSGPVALFVHGVPLHGYHWRHAIAALRDRRRCIAADLMGLGYTEIAPDQPVSFTAQAAMLAQLLDALGIDRVDLVGNDSGGAVAQLFMIRNPGRVRTLLLTNCDVEPDSPPPKVMPVIELARKGTLTDQLAQWLADKAQARAQFGTAVFSRPRELSDETIECYFAPNVASPLRRAQFNAYHAALAPNPLAGVEAELARCAVPARIVWGTGDDIFAQTSADYLDRTLPKSRGVRRVPGGKLFFPEEYPDVIAEEARRLWGITG